MSVLIDLNSKNCAKIDISCRKMHDEWKIKLKFARFLPKGNKKRLSYEQKNGVDVVLLLDVDSMWTQQTGNARRISHRHRWF